MKEHLDILLALAAFVCLVNATADPNAKPLLAPKNSTDQAVTTVQGGDNNGGAGAVGSTRESISGGPDGGTGVASSASVSAAAVGSGGGSRIGSGGGSITVLGSGSRPVAGSINTAPVEKPDQVPRNRSDQSPLQGLGGSVGGGADGGVRLPQVNGGDHGGDRGGGLGGSPAGGSQPGLSSSRVGAAAGGTPGTPGGRRDRVPGGTAFGSSSSASGASFGVPGSGLHGGSSSSGTFGLENIRDGFPEGLGDSNSMGNFDDASGGPEASTSVTSASRSRSSAEGLGSFNGRAGGGDDERAGRPGAQRNPPSGGLGFTTSSSASGGFNGNPENEFAQGGSSRTSSRLGGGSTDSGGRSSSAGNSHATFSGLGGPASGSAGSVHRSPVSGRVGPGVTANRAGRPGEQQGNQPSGRVDSGRRSGASAASGNPGRGLSRTGPRGSSGLGSRIAVVGQAGGRNAVGGGGRSGVPIAGQGGHRNSGFGTNWGSNRSPESRSPTSGLLRDSSGTGDDDSASLGGASSGSNANGTVGRAGGDTGSSNSGDSNLGSSRAGTRISAGRSGRLGPRGRGSGGGEEALSPSQTESGQGGGVPESDTGNEGSNDRPSEQNSPDGGSTSTDDNTPLSIPLGDGPLGMDIPKWLPRINRDHRPDPAVAAAVALGALAGVAAVGALGAGIAAAVHARRRQYRPVVSARRRGAGSGRRKPAISRRGRERRSIPESKVAAEILDQIPMNFDRLY